jgi:signal transduction histidine kinase
MIQDLLDAARIAANQLLVDRATVDLVELVELSIEQARLAHPDVEIRFDASTHHLAWIDADRIQQVLDNLLSNAAKYRGKGTPIVVEVRGDATEVTVCVINEGTEIAADELKRLFTRFTRTRETRASGRPGIGLGLYICKGLIEAHGGRIWAESEPGLTQFCFSVPASQPR